MKFVKGAGTMRRTLKRTMLVVFCLSLILMAAYIHGQAPLANERLPANAVLTGNDLGFQLDYVQGGKAIGSWMVKVNNTRVPVGSVVGTRTLK
jgi:hypothetical protein